MNQFTWPRFNFDEEFPRLKTAPIIEAVIYWQADVSKTYEQSEFANLLSERLPNYVNSQSLFIQSIQAEGILGNTSKFSHETLWTGFKLDNLQNHYVAQFHQSGVVFSRLAPYEEWQSFLTEGISFWQVFQDIAQPTSLQRLGVRYINKIPLKGNESASTYLEMLQPHPKDLEIPAESFFYQDTYKVPDSPYAVNWVRTMQQQVSTNNPELALILDIDAYTEAIVDLAEEHLVTQLNNMRWLKNKTFFGCITQTALERFNA
jgi:uncharacterized protein (TIGR04255 family)